MKNENKKSIDIKKIIAIISCITIISTIFVLSCFAVLNSAPQNNVLYYFDEISQGSGTSKQYEVSGYYIVNDIEHPFDHIQIVLGSGLIYDATFEYDGATVKIINNNNRENIHFYFTNIEVLNHTIQGIFQQHISEVPHNFYEDGNDLLNFSLNSVHILINYMITNNVILIIIAIVIVSFAVGVLIRLTNKKF